MYFLFSFYNKNNHEQLLNVLTLFMPKRSVPLLLFLTFGLVACGNPSNEINGVYETTISTTSDFETDSLVSADPITSDSLASAQDSVQASSDRERSGQEVSDPGRTLLLELHRDHRAELRTSFLNNAPAIVQKGTWALLENNRVRTYFIEKNGKFFKDTLTFHRDGLRLVLRGKRNSVTDEVNLLRIQ